jgi:hypothetical protein
MPVALSAVLGGLVSCAALWPGCGPAALLALPVGGSLAGLAMALRLHAVSLDAAAPVPAASRP